MKNYDMIFVNNKNQERISGNVSKLTFSEAASEAYKKKGILGFDWEIESIVKTAKFKTHSGYVKGYSSI